MSFEPTPSAPPPISVPSAARIKRRLKRVGPLSAGTTLVLLCTAFALTILPLVILMVAEGPGPQRASPVEIGVVFTVLTLVAFSAMGFLTGVIGAALYNLFARWTGGIEVEIE